LAVSKGDALEQLRLIRMDLTNAQAKLTDAMRTVSALNLPEKAAVPCPVYGIDRRTTSLLEEHLANVHDIRPPTIEEAA
jgi:predicted deacetylase